MAIAWILGGKDLEEPEDAELEKAEITLGMPAAEEYKSHHMHVTRCGVRYQITFRTLRGIRKAQDGMRRQMKIDRIETRLYLVALAVTILGSNHDFREAFVGAWQWIARL